MKDSNVAAIPQKYALLEGKCKDLGFGMASDLLIGPFLRTLVGSKPAGHFLELGTGIGLSLIWMIDGLSEDASLITIDNDNQLTEIVREQLGDDSRVEFVCADGSSWLKEYTEPLFDLIFADAWPGKYNDLDITPDLLKAGGLYIIDDMREQENWPEGHVERASDLVEYLETRDDLHLAKMDWSTGVIMASKKY